jgi:anti-sigma factor RsiW
MNCDDVRNLAPLYLSGEMEGELRQGFSAHLAACPVCERELEQQAGIDARILEAVEGNMPDSSRIEQLVRRQLFLRAFPWRRLTAAAAAAAAFVLGWFSLSSAPGWYAEAARDHQTEVVEKHPRHWRTDPAEIALLAASVGLSDAQAASLAPPGYRLEHAKICSLRGRRVLHLVFSRGTTEYSVYLVPHRRLGQGGKVRNSGQERVAGFESRSLAGLVVTTGSAAECKELAELTAARL